MTIAVVPSRWRTSPLLIIVASGVSSLLPITITLMLGPILITIVPSSGLTMTAFSSLPITTMLSSRPITISSFVPTRSPATIFVSSSVACVVVVGGGGPPARCLSSALLSSPGGSRVSAIGTGSNLQDAFRWCISAFCGTVDIVHARHTATAGVDELLHETHPPSEMRTWGRCCATGKDSNFQSERSILCFKKSIC